MAVSTPSPAPKTKKQKIEETAKIQEVARLVLQERAKRQTPGGNGKRGVVQKIIERYSADFPYVTSAKVYYAAKKLKLATPVPGGWIPNNGTVNVEHVAAYPDNPVFPSQDEVEEVSEITAQGSNGGDRARLLLQAMQENWQEMQGIINEKKQREAHHAKRQKRHNARMATLEERLQGLQVSHALLMQELSAEHQVMAAAGASNAADWQQVNNKEVPTNVERTSAV